MQYRRVSGLTVPLLLPAAVAHATLDSVTLQVKAVLSGPVALTLAVLGLVGATIVYLIERDGRTFIMLAALAAGAALSSQLQPLAKFFFPG
jgi:type IV secretory pathway VirB2 component (pilin)